MRQASPWAPERNSTGVSIVARPHSPHAISSPMTAASSVTRVISAGSGLSSTRPNLAEWWAPDASVQVRRARGALGAAGAHLDRLGDHPGMRRNGGHQAHVGNACRSDQLSTLRGLCVSLLTPLSFRLIVSLVRRSTFCCGCAKHRPGLTTLGGYLCKLNLTLRRSSPFSTTQ